ncbi:uncharacterized protein LOC144646056 [Oculina patagonica]
MALDKLDSLMILACAVALIILLSLMVYTWYKWHVTEVKRAATSNESNESAEVDPAIEMTSYTPHHYPNAHFQHGYLNEVGRDSPNLSGSRTFLNEDVLKQKPFHKDAHPPPAFETKDVVYHADAERDPNVLKSGDIVFHANGPFDDNKTTNGLQSSHVVYNTDDVSGKRRWTESMVPGEDEGADEVSHRKNTYL